MASFKTCGDDDEVGSVSPVVVVVVEVVLVDVLVGGGDDEELTEVVVGLRGRGATPLGLGAIVLVDLRLRWLLDDFSSDDEATACEPELDDVSDAPTNEPLLVIDARCGTGDDDDDDDDVLCTFEPVDFRIN